MIKVYRSPLLSLYSYPSSNAQRKINVIFLTLPPLITLSIVLYNLKKYKCCHSITSKESFSNPPTHPKRQFDILRCLCMGMEGSPYNPLKHPISMSHNIQILIRHNFLNVQNYQEHVFWQFWASQPVQQLRSNLIQVLQMMQISKIFSFSQFFQEKSLLATNSLF